MDLGLDLSSSTGQPVLLSSLGENSVQIHSGYLSRLNTGINFNILKWWLLKRVVATTRDYLQQAMLCVTGGLNCVSTYHLLDLLLI